MREKQLKLIAEALLVEHEDISEDTVLDTIDNYDSMAKLALIMMFVDVYNIKPDPNEIKQFKTVKDIIDRIG